ncbi:hypothetical protein [Haloterrigena gelatinilytica]|uniref:hypothetical protein n=1 Tax=Haloterrigena gelatinilytica TaxID=2741724 RepID=UPI001C2DFA94|nr:hypothetical protein [Haloterrigena gelatinilytica]
MIAQLSADGNVDTNGVIAAPAALSSNLLAEELSRFWTSRRTLSEVMNNRQTSLDEMKLALWEVLAIMTDLDQQLPKSLSLNASINELRIKHSFGN